VRDDEDGAKHVVERGELRIVGTVVGVSVAAAERRLAQLLRPRERVGERVAASLFTWRRWRRRPVV